MALRELTLFIFSYLSLIASYYDVLAVPRGERIVHHLHVLPRARLSVRVEYSEVLLHTQRSLLPRPRTCHFLFHGATEADSVCMVRLNQNLFSNIPFLQTHLSTLCLKSSMPFINLARYAQTSLSERKLALGNTQPGLELIGSATVLLRYMSSSQKR